MRASLFLVVALNGAVHVLGHAYMSWPSSRNFDKCDFFDPQSVNGHCSNCNQDACGRFGNIDFTAVAHSVTGTYAAGDMLDVEIVVTAHHKGYMEVRLCTDPNNMTQDCFNKHVLHRDSQTQVGDPAPVDTAFPGRWYMPPPGASWPQSASSSGANFVAVPAVVVPNTNGNNFVPNAAQSLPYSLPSSSSANKCGRSKVGTRYQWRVRIPSNVQCNHCVLQWFWVTANSCNPVGLTDYYDRVSTQDWITSKFGGNVQSWFSSGLHTCSAAVSDPKTNGNGGEKFWNCGDIRISSCSGNNCNVGTSTSGAVLTSSTRQSGTTTTTTAGLTSAVATTTAPTSAGTSITTTTTSVGTQSCRFNNGACDQATFCRNIVSVGGSGGQCNCTARCPQSTVTTTTPPVCVDYAGVACTGCLATNNVCYMQNANWCSLFAGFRWCGSSMVATTTIMPSCTDYNGASCSACLASNRVCYAQSQQWCSIWSSYKWCGPQNNTQWACEGIKGMSTAWCQGNYQGQCEAMAKAHPNLCKWTPSQSSGNTCLVGAHCDVNAFCAAYRSTTSSVDCMQVCNCQSSFSLLSVPGTSVPGTNKSNIFGISGGQPCVNGLTFFPILCLLAYSIAGHF